MRTIDAFIVHGAATPATMDIGAEEIRSWHYGPRFDAARGEWRWNGQWWCERPAAAHNLPNGNGWNDIGYHYVIRRDGTIELGRKVKDIGAHVTGHNTNSIGICLVGSGLRDGNSGPAEPNYTEAQYASLRILLTVLKGVFPNARVFGHSDFDPSRKPHCPGFSAAELIAA